MPRVNIEDRWWTDPRRQALVERMGSFQRADGLAVHIWRLNQSHLDKHGVHPIPLALLSSIDGFSDFVAVNLARISDDVVHIYGAQTAFDWLVKSRINGEIGGKISAKSRQEKYGTPQPKTVNEYRSLSEASSKPIQPSSSSSSSSSVSSEIHKTNTSLRECENADAISTPEIKRSGKFSEGTREKMRAFIAAYVVGWTKRYGAYPEGIRNKMLVGRLGHWLETVSEEKAIALVQVFLQIEYKPFVDSLHDLWLFLKHLSRINIALSTGRAAGEMDWSALFEREKARTK